MATRKKKASASLGPLIERAGEAFRAVLEAAGEGKSPTRKALRKAVEGAVVEEAHALGVEAEAEQAFFASLAFALVDWNDGHLHGDVREGVSRWNLSDVHADHALRRLAEIGEGAREIHFASLRPERLVYGALMPVEGKRPAHALVIDGAAVVGRVQALGLVLSLPAGVAYTGKTAEGWRLFLGDKKSRPFDAIESVALHEPALVAVARKGKKRAVLWGERFSGWYDEVRLPDWTGRFAEAAPEVFLDALDEARPVAFAARNGKRWRVFEGLVPGPEHDEVCSLGWGEKGLSYLARDGERWSLYQDGAAGPSYDEVSQAAFLGGRPVFRARQGERWCIVDDGREGRMFDEIGQGEMADTEPVYTARDGERWWLMLGERPLVDLRGRPNEMLATVSGGEPMAWEVSLVFPDGTSQTVKVTQPASG